MNRDLTEQSSQWKLPGLLTKEQNNLVLYDVLKSRDLSTFCRLVKNGYGVCAFILNCMKDFGFEKNIDKVLTLCHSYDYDVYDFLVLLRGKEEAEKFFVKNNFTSLVENKFDNDALVRNQQWELLLKKEEYSLLYKNGQIDLLLKKMSTEQILQAFRKNGDAEGIEALGKEFGLDTNCYLLEFSEGRKKLLEQKKWKDVLELSYSTTYVNELGFNSENDLFEYIFENGGKEELYEGKYSARKFLLKKEEYDIFIRNHNWYGIFNYGGIQQIIDLDDWWEYIDANKDCESQRDYLISVAIKRKDWNFLEKRQCLKVLFRHYRWQRWYRAFVASQV